MDNSNWPSLNEPQSAYNGFNYYPQTLSQSNFYAQQGTQHVKNSSSNCGGLVANPYINTGENPYPQYMTTQQPQPQPFQNITPYAQPQQFYTPQCNYTSDGVTYTFHRQTENPYRDVDNRYTMPRVPQQQQNLNGLSHHIALKELENHCLESMLLQEQRKRNPYMVRFTQNQVTTTDDLAGGNKSQAMSDIANQLYASEANQECPSSICPQSNRRRLLIKEPTYNEKSIQTDYVTIINNTMDVDSDHDVPTKHKEHKCGEKSIRTHHETIVNDKMDVDQDPDVPTIDKDKQSTPARSNKKKRKKQVSKNKNFSNSTFIETSSGKFKQTDKQRTIPNDNVSNSSKNISSSDNSTCSSRSNISNNGDSMDNDYEMSMVNKKGNNKDKPSTKDRPKKKKLKKNVTSGKVKQTDTQCSKPDDNAFNICKNIDIAKDDPTSSSDNSTRSSCSNISNDCDNMDDDYKMGILNKKRKNNDKPSTKVISKKKKEKKNVTSDKVKQIDKQCSKPDDISKNIDNAKDHPTSLSDNSTRSSCSNIADDYNNMDNDYKMGVVNKKNNDKSSTKVISKKKKGKKNATSGKVKQIDKQCNKPEYNACDICKNIGNANVDAASSSDNSTHSSCSNIYNDCDNMDNDHEMSIVNEKGKTNDKVRSKKKRRKKNVTYNKHVQVIKAASKESNDTGHNCTGPGLVEHTDTQCKIPDNNASDISKNHDNVKSDTTSSSDNSSSCNIITDCNNMDNDYKMSVVKTTCVPAESNCSADTDDGFLTDEEMTILENAWDLLRK